MTSLRHVMILASAGSGKTFALTNRFVALLAAGAEPERIVALTFTRKAAGEFFDEILKKLAGASRDDVGARRLAGAIGRPEMTATDFLRLLRRMVDAMHRLRLGTFDGFFARIAKSFPLELGLAGEFEILQEHAARIERRRVLRRMFARSGHELEAAQSDFIEAFKRATFGAEEKQLGARLDAFLDEHQENFLAAPRAELWGDPRRIWPAGSRWLDADIKLADAVRELRSTLGALTDGQRARWEAFFSALEEWMPGAPLPGPIDYILNKAFTAWSDLCGGRAEIVIDRRKLTMPAGACRALERIITHVVGAQLRRHLETTRGIFSVLQGYEAVYHHAVRRAGRLTFADVQRLLQPDGGAPALSVRRMPQPGAVGADRVDSQMSLPLAVGGGERIEVGSRDADERRLMLDYRLDSEIDHWLLDEFQDTSYGQWSVLRNLIDEVIQDSEQRRTFFCVGDVKQAIYAWREGDPRLFREIFNHYNSAMPGVIDEQHLVASWRSGPALIEMVNAVFGSAATLAELFPGAATDAWNREWRAHESAVPERIGQAALLHADDEQGRWGVVRELLQEIQPLARGLSCAVLVKRNDTAAVLANELRQAGIAAIAESDLHIATDNPVGAALLALVRAAVHPGDTLAVEHLAMTPLGTVLEEQGLAGRDVLTARLLEQIHSDGFEGTLEYWVGQLEPRLASDDQFSRVRAREIVAAAGLFDAGGSRDADEFIAFMERYSIRPAESAAVVRVMTIHKSKGLGFDVVILPDLEGKRIDERRDGLAVQKAADRSVDWILDLPPKLFRTQDDVLASHVRAAKADACYENLSLLYVALTRAKRAMYVVVEPVGTSTSLNFPKLLSETLGEGPVGVQVGNAEFPGAWTSGVPDWHQAVALSDTRTAGAERGAHLEPLRIAGERHGRHSARRPSAGWRSKTPAGALFGLDHGMAADFGTALHTLLSEVEWVDFADPSVWVRKWSDDGKHDAVVAAALQCLRAPALADVWRKPAGPGGAEVWRERSFEIVADGEWITGVFDRVVVYRDASGKATKAKVYDFKTDRIAPDTDPAAAARRYSDQIGVYRRVAAVLANVPVHAVDAEIVYTQLGQAFTVPELARRNSAGQGDKPPAG